MKRECEMTPNVNPNGKWVRQQYRLMVINEDGPMGNQWGINGESTREQWEVNGSNVDN